LRWKPRTDSDLKKDLYLGNSASQCLLFEYHFLNLSCAKFRRNKKNVLHFFTTQKIVLGVEKLERSQQTSVTGFGKVLPFWKKVNSKTRICF
jgi:hypothetical protein